MPKGLVPGDRLPAPAFTPTTKAHEGHDAPLTYAELTAAHGADLARTLRDTALSAYAAAAEIAATRGLLLVDTKLELGHDASGALVIADEVFTADSSRYWEASAWRPGTVPEDCDDVARLPGITTALVEVGWLTFTPAGCLVLGWDKHNGESAKRRAEDAERKRLARLLGKQ